MDRKTFDWRLEFEPNLIELPIDYSWVKAKISDALECLELNAVPLTDKKCKLCSYCDRLSFQYKIA